ncbi:trypsin domain-containing protein [Ditylenchus destructor]|uniref:Trypsin domain-containing protein n=1 Tax=Ditylenchus destructor TaxID=166010 RepID=A0AAD4ME89_9BILA|nr:trypsin domain-containing protein [Ditylenchus destructor]
MHLPKILDYNTISSFSRSLAPVQPWPSAKLLGTRHRCRGLLNKYSHDFVEQCFKTTEAYWKNPPSVENVKFAWAAVLLNQRINSSLEVVCTATLITHQHLVTTRSCIVGWLDANKHRLSNGTWEEPAWILMAGGECYAKGLNCTEVDMVELKVDFIAPVADETDRVAPACLQTRHERFYLTKLIAYGWTKRDPNNSSHVPSPRMQRTVLRLHPEAKCSAGDHDDFDVSSCVYKAPGMQQFPNTWDIGTPAVKMYTYSFAAMFTSVASAKKPRNDTKYGNVAYSFWDVTSFDSLFCTYFNYCPRNDRYLENVIPYFDTFFYPN